MKHLKLFENHTEYEGFVSGGTMVKPNVSHCVQENEVHYNPRTWADEYFTTVARENGTISFNLWKSMGTEYITSISYSTDNGETWATTNNTDNKSEHLVITVNVSEGDNVLWKGDAKQLGYYDVNEGAAIGSFFSSDGEFDVQGNIMSLLYGDDFKGQTDLTGKDCAFAYLFYDYDGEKVCKVVNAKNLSLPAVTLVNGCYDDMFYYCTNLTTAPELPATTLAQYCYRYMFGECINLTAAPELPATTLANDCYYSMFGGCTSLATAPELPVTTLANYCYSHMFNGCTSLTTAPVLPATTLAEHCYDSMFYGCTSLTTAPELPATTLAEDCYANMFVGCTSLTTAPVLPATSLASGCYQSMFYNCTSLITAPQLPATTLTYGCYGYMFYGCTSLTTAPQLPATTLEEYCYNYMFAGCTSLATAPELPGITLVRWCYSYMFNNCSSLNYIKAMFTTTPGTDYTISWVSGVASSGTFVKNAAATWTATGITGIPTGWTVETATA